MVRIIPLPSPLDSLQRGDFSFLEINKQKLYSKYSRAPTSQKILLKRHPAGLALSESPITSFTYFIRHFQ